MQISNDDNRESFWGARCGKTARRVLLGAGSARVIPRLPSTNHTVNHDKLMALIAREIKDKRVLKLIRLFLQSGVMINGVYVDTEEGCPRGGPLSPILSNIMLTEFDRELERRGHRFCRYADDCNIYIKSKRAGERVMAGA